MPHLVSGIAHIFNIVFLWIRYKHIYSAYQLIRIKSRMDPGDIGVRTLMVELVSEYCVPRTQL